MVHITQRISPCLWFDTQAEEAAHFYAAIFPDSAVGQITHYGAAGAKASGQPEGSVMTVAFSLAGQDFLGMNCGPAVKFSWAVSFIVNCDSQDEIDFYWDKLGEGGAPQQCGWVTDRYGLSWQVVPAELWQMMQHPDSGKRDRVFAELLQMVKLDLGRLRGAFNSGE